MANNMEKKSKEMTTQNGGFAFHPIRAIKGWWESLPPWGRTLVSLAGIGAGAYVTHDAMDHGLIPDIKIANILEFTTKPKESDDDDDLS